MNRPPGRRRTDSSPADTRLPGPGHLPCGITVLAGGTSHSAALRSDGTVLTWGYNAYGQLCDGTYSNRLTPYLVSSLTGISSLDVGNLHTLALRSDGTAMACGYNEYGQVGDGSTIHRTTPVWVVGL